MSYKRVEAFAELYADFYDRGGGAGSGAALEHQTLSPDPLNLTDGDRRALVAFMHTLTATTGLTTRPARLPRLGDARLDTRLVGGSC